MGNCTSTRYLETESETYVFHVTNVDHDEKAVTTGTLKVTPSELIYDGQDKKDRIVWAWHHVVGFACDGHVFRIKVGRGHCKGNGDYWFTSKDVAALFLRVHNCIFTNNKVEQRQVAETNARSSSLPGSASPSSRNGSLTSPSSRTSTPKHKKILHSEVSTSQSTSSVKVDHVTASMSCESGSVQSMEPRAKSSSSDVASSGWPLSSGYVNLTPYVNVNTSDSPPPPPLPPKCIKKIPIDKFDEESLDGLSGVSCNSEVFLPTQKNESKDEGIAHHFISRQSSSASCSLCDHKSQATAYCHDCEGLVCAECAAQHQRMSTFANHSLLFKRSQPMEGKDTTCSSGTTAVKYSQSMEGKDTTCSSGTTAVKYSQSMEGKDTTCSSGTTAMKYSDIIFPSPQDDTQLGSPLASHKRAQSYEGRDMHVVSYSKIDHATSESLSQLKDQRMTERSWSTKERRASMGAKFSQSGVRYSK